MLLSVKIKNPAMAVSSKMVAIVIMVFPFLLKGYHAIWGCQMKKEKIL